MIYGAYRYVCVMPSLGVLHTGPGIVVKTRRLKDYLSVRGVSDAMRVSFCGLRT